MTSDPIRLRPHHLLCTQAYVGKGYSPEFVRHMDEVLAQLKSENAPDILLTFGEDELCSACPHRQVTGLCDSQAKVEQLDRSTAEAFGLSEGRYSYQEVAAAIKSQLTPKLLFRICGHCNWYGSGICAEQFFKEIDGS